MADYWVSQEKKYCEMCKCWMAGNKISIGIHENGNKHKDNVKRQLDSMTKKSNQVARQEKAVKDALKQMNEGALKSMMKDLVNDPKSAQQYGVHLSETAKKEIEHKVSSGNKETSSTSSSNATNKSDESIRDDGDWVEAMTDDGHPYYWNSVTRETSWFKPEPSPNQKVKIEQQGDKSRISSFISEKLEELGAKREDIVEKEEIKSEINPEWSKFDPYGSWKTVSAEKLPKLDLPKSVTPVETKPAISEPDDAPVLQISEKIAPKRPATSNTARIVFKKPKQTSANLRPKTDDE